MAYARQRPPLGQAVDVTGDEAAVGASSVGDSGAHDPSSDDLKQLHGGPAIPAVGGEAAGSRKPATARGVDASGGGAMATGRPSGSAKQDRGTPTNTLKREVLAVGLCNVNKNGTSELPQSSK